MPKKVNKCTVSYGTFILSAALACLLAQLHFFMAKGHFKEKKNLYLLFTLRFWFYSVSQRAQTNTFKPRCLLLGFSLCAVQSYPVPQSINPHHTIFYTGVSYLSCILHALRQAFSFWYIQSLPKMSHPENFWVYWSLGNCQGSNTPRNFLGVLCWCWCGRNSTMLGLSDNQEYQQMKGAEWSSTRLQGTEKGSRKCHKITLPPSYANLAV